MGLVSMHETHHEGATEVAVKSVDTGEYLGYFEWSVATRRYFLVFLPWRVIVFLQPLCLLKRCLKLEPAPVSCVFLITRVCLLMSSAIFFVPLI